MTSIRIAGLLRVRGRYSDYYPSQTVARRGHRRRYYCCTVVDSSWSWGCGYKTRPASSFSTTTTTATTTATDTDRSISQNPINCNDSTTAKEYQKTLSTIPSTIHNETPTSSMVAMSQHFAELSKARLSALVVSTTAFGFLAAGPTALALSSLPTFGAASIGTALCASSAATFNQILEIERDRCMKRTGNRPLVTGVVTKNMAWGLGCFTGTSGGLILSLGTDPITTMLGVGNIALYAGLYTHLKPISESNTWVGAVVGAIPPVMGWTAAGGSLFDAEAVLLGGTLFLWQFPHFFALNWMYRTDYKRGGFAMVAVNDLNGDRTARLIRRYALYLTSIPFISSALEVTSPMFAVDAGILLNGYALYVASKFSKDRSNANARKVFLTSLWYLPCVMMLFLLHSRRWHEEVVDNMGNKKMSMVLAVDNDGKIQMEEEEIMNASLLVRMQKIMNEIQSKGREMCMHEAIASKDVEVWLASESKKAVIDGSKCPVSIGKAVAENCTAIAQKQELTLLKRESRSKEG